MATHLQLLDEVNESKTQIAHDLADAWLNGWRDGVGHMGGFWSSLDADNHTAKKYGKGRPMCCGVLMDWKPAKA